MKLVRDILFVMTSNLMNLALSFLYNPILVRLFNFTPEDFGLTQLYLSYFSIISAFQIISINIAFTSEHTMHRHYEKKSFLVYSTVITAMVTLASSIVVSAISNLEFIPFLFLAFTGGIFQLPYTFNRDEKEFGTVSKALAIRSVTSLIFGLTFVLISRSYIGVIWGYTVSYTVAAAYSGKHHFRSIMGAAFKARWFPIFLKRNANVIIYETLTNTLNTFSFNSPILFIEKIFGNEVLGLYSLGYRLLTFTNQLFSKALSETFLPYMSKSENDQKIFFKNFYLISGFFFIVYFFIIAFSDFAILLLFGPDYEKVSKIIKIMSIWLFSQVSISPYVSILNVKNKAHVGTVLSIVFLVLRIGSLMLGHYFDFYFVMNVYTFVSAALYFSFFVYSISLVDIPKKHSQILMIFLYCFALFIEQIENGVFIILPVVLYVAYILFKNARRMLGMLREKNGSHS